MPICAQWVGECLPLTNYIRIMRCSMLKGGRIWATCNGTASGSQG
jgi:hypothetical protein